MNQRGLNVLLFVLAVAAFLNAHAAARQKAAQKAIEKELGKFDADLEGA